MHAWMPLGLLLAVLLHWESVDPARLVQVERRPFGGQYRLLAVVQGEIYLDQRVQPLTAYCYRVSYVDDGTTSREICVTTFAAETAEEDP